MLDEFINEILSDTKELKGIMNKMKKSELIGATIVFIAFGLMLLVLPMLFI